MQTVCLLARELEARGLVTVTLSQEPELARIVGAPRVLELAFPFGAPFGDAGNASLHRAVLEEAWTWLTEATEPGAIRRSPLAWRRDPRPDATASGGASGT